MFNIENINPWINRNFGINANVSFNLAGTNNVALAGGLQDSDTATASLQEFIPEVWGASTVSYQHLTLPTTPAG